MIRYFSARARDLKLHSMCYSVSTVYLQCSFEKAEMMSAFFCGSSRVADSIMRSPMYASSCANMSFQDSPGSSMLSSLTWDSATSRMSKNASHVVGAQ